ncbi:hypothetical protein TNCV_1544001 [Trichonephila clavipes]|nr:hypothetical protein TNCV_1544001 [Trichonephila clavipes]
MLGRIYGDLALSMKSVYEWFARFREARESVSDNSRSGKSVISVSEENIKKGRHGTTQLRVKEDIEDFSSEIDEGSKGCTSWMKRPELYCSSVKTVSPDVDGPPGCYLTSILPVLSVFVHTWSDIEPIWWLFSIFSRTP